MVRPRSEQDEGPVFSHQVLALLARMAREDRDLVGAAYRRARSRQNDKIDNFHVAIGALPPSMDGPYNHLHLPSATGRDRQIGALRVPHFDMKPITRTVVPTSADGVVHERFKNAAASAARHFDYIVDGGIITLTSHLDYLQREGASEVPDGDLVLVDLAEEHEERWLKNALSIYTNIPGGPERQRHLFAAAEASEQTPKKHYLTLSTADLDKVGWITDLATCPTWLRGMERRLRTEKIAIEERASAAGKIAKHQRVVVAEVTPEQAYDVLRWFDDHPRAPRPEWKQGKTGRNHYRFVGELPKGISNRQRHRIMRAFVNMLAKDGWMAVGVIHQPDQHNDKRNYHFHVDAYDRPARWLEKQQCWDFEWKVRRNGKDTFPLRQKKVSYREADNAGKFRKVDTATIMRNRYIDIVNAVVGNRPSIDYYVKGTYADNGIDLTPLEHLGNRAAALERRGTVTAAGLRNARRVAADDLAAIDRQAEESLLAISRRCDAFRLKLVGQLDALDAVDELEWLRRRDVRRREETSIAELVDDMARSRAEVVAAVLSPEPGRREKRKKGDKELRQAALDHLTWVNDQRPSTSEKNDVRDKVWVSEERCSELEALICASLEGNAQDRKPLIYVPRVLGRTLSLVSNPHYRQQMEQRLIRWMKRNGHNPALLQFSGAQVTLGKKVPPAIDTLMQRFAITPAVQRLVLAERLRRYEAGRSVQSSIEATSIDTINVRSLPQAEAQISPVEGRQLAAAATSSDDLSKSPQVSNKAEQAKRLGYEKRIGSIDPPEGSVRAQFESLGKGPPVNAGHEATGGAKPKTDNSDAMEPTLLRSGAGSLRRKAFQRSVSLPTSVPAMLPASFHPFAPIAGGERPTTLHSVRFLSQAPSIHDVPTLGSHGAKPGVVRQSTKIAASPPPRASVPAIEPAASQDQAVPQSQSARSAVHRSADSARTLARALAVATAMPFLPLRPHKRDAEPMRYLIDKTHAVSSDLTNLSLIHDHQKHPRMQRLLQSKHAGMRQAVLDWLATRPSRPEGDVRKMFDHDPQLAAAVWTAWGHLSLRNVVDQARAVWIEREKAAAFTLEELRRQQNTGKGGPGR